MKYDVDCPQCGGALRLNPGTGSMCCDRPCNRWFTEQQILEHMREKPGVDRNAPAFRQLDPRDDEWDDLCDPTAEEMAEVYRSLGVWCQSGSPHNPQGCDCGESG